MVGAAAGGAQLVPTARPKHDGVRALAAGAAVRRQAGPYVKVQQARDWLSKGWWRDKGGRSGAANGEGAFFLLSGALESNFFRVE